MALPFYVSPSDPPAKQEIVKAALRLFVQKGIAETSIRDIAAASGYTNPALFKHFESKDALGLHLFERCYERFAAELEEATAGAGDFGVRLRSVLDRLCGLLDEDLDAFLFMQDHLRTYWPRVSPALRPRSILALLRKLLKRGVASGDVRQDVELDLLVAGMVGLFAQLGRMLYFGELKGRAADWTDDLERMVLGQVSG